MSAEESARPTVTQLFECTREPFATVSRASVVPTRDDCNEGFGMFRQSGLVALFTGAILHLLALPAQGQESLTLARVQRLALESQPLVEAQAAEIESRRERAIAAGQLPDPELQFAINELPVNTADAWSLSRDGDTDEENNPRRPRQVRMSAF